MREMKDSGVEWIGEIPKDWKVQRLKAVLCERNELNNPVKTDFVLSLTNDRGVIPYTEKGDIGNKSKDDLTGYKLAYPDDIVLNSMNVIIGSVDLSRYFGCVSPVYYMLHKRLKQDEIKYYNYLFQTKELQNRLKGYGNGIMEIRMRIQMSKLNTVLLPVPSSDEQAKIASYLDSKCSQINTIIEKQKTVIEKLKDYKISLITEAVTKGLNPDVPMKDSGVEWIGKIPEHWKTGPIKVFAYILPGFAFSSNEFSTENGIPLLRGINVTPSGLRWDEVVFWNQDLPDSMKQYLLKYGDVVMGLDRPWVSDGTRITFVDMDNILLVQRVCKINSKVGTDVRWLYHWLNSKAFENSVSVDTTGVSVPHISTKQIGEFIISKPTIDEQRQIADFLDRKCSAIDATISKKQALIEKLKAYKKSLIYEVVTGKKEV